MNHCCTGADDYFLSTTRIRTTPVAPLTSVAFTLRVDGVAQELNEMFTLSILLGNNLNNIRIFPETPLRIVDTLNGTIIDEESELRICPFRLNLIFPLPAITFQLLEKDYVTLEHELFVGVKILKHQDVVLANNVIFRVTPLTIDQALARGLLSSYAEPTDEDVSPSKAGVLRSSYRIVMHCKLFSFPLHPSYPLLFPPVSSSQFFPLLTHRR